MISTVSISRGAFLARFATIYLSARQEYRDAEKDQRQKRKVVVFVKESKTAKSLCTSLGQHRRLYKSMKKGFVKKYVLHVGFPRLAHLIAVSTAMTANECKPVLLDCLNGAFAIAGSSMTLKEWPSCSST